MHIIYDVEYLAGRPPGRTMVAYHDGTSETIDITAIRLLDGCCRYHGATLAGRRQSICQRLGIRRKAPILVYHLLGCIFFPLHGRRSAAGQWINYSQVSGLLRTEPCTIVFRSGRRLTADASFRTVRRQVQRCEAFMQQVAAVMPPEDFDAIVKEK